MLLTSDVALVDGVVREKLRAAHRGRRHRRRRRRATISPRRAKPVIDLGRRAMVPGTVNAHNHSFQSLLRGFGDDLPFLEWRDKALYRYSPRLGAEGMDTGALFAFGEMLLHGVTTVCDFFYLNDGGNDNARAVDRGRARARHAHRHGALLLRLGRRAGARIARPSPQARATLPGAAQRVRASARDGARLPGAALPARRVARR